MSFGRLERGVASQPMSEINVTPLVDVMLVLVVIFIITAPLLASAIRLDLPRTEAAQPVDAPRFITLTVDSGGQLFVNDKVVDFAALQAELSQTAAQSPDTEVRLRADETVPYGKVVEVMGAAQKAGLSRIGFIAEAPAAPAAPVATTPPPKR